MAIRPGVVARSGLHAVLAANAAAVLYFFAQADLASDTLIVLGRLTGLFGALLMAFQLLLVAHRQLGVTEPQIHFERFSLAG